MSREGEKLLFILSNNFTYTGVVISEDDFFFIIRDKFGGKVTIGKKDIQVIKELQ